MPRPVHTRRGMHVGRGAPTLATPPLHARGAAADTHRRAPTAASGTPLARPSGPGTSGRDPHTKFGLPILRKRWQARDTGTTRTRLACWNKVLRWSSKAGPDPPYGCNETSTAATKPQCRRGCGGPRHALAPSKPGGAVPAGHTTSCASRGAHLRDARRRGYPAMAPENHFPDSARPSRRYALPSKSHTNRRDILRRHAQNERMRHAPALAGHHLTLIFLPSPASFTGW